MSKVELQNLRREVSLMQSLSHNNIVKFYDFYDEEDKCYLVMEKICGGELFDRIVTKDHYSEREAKDVTRVLLSAIKHLHDQNIVHR